MFDWIPTDSVLFWIWASGFCLVSGPVLIVWAVNSTLLGDSSDEWYRRKMFAWFTFLGFVMTWLWPIGFTGFGIYEWHSAARKRKRAKIWAHKKENVPNYWKNYYLIINGVVSDIQVRVLDWEYSEFIPGKARLSLWSGDSRFWADKGKEILVYWPNKDLEPIPEKDVKL